MRCYVTYVESALFLSVHRTPRKPVKYFCIPKEPVCTLRLVTFTARKANPRLYLNTTISNATIFAHLLPLTAESVASVFTDVVLPGIVPVSEKVEKRFIRIAWSRSYISRKKKTNGHEGSKHQLKNHRRKEPSKKGKQISYSTRAFSLIELLF